MFQLLFYPEKEGKIMTCKKKGRISFERIIWLPLHECRVKCIVANFRPTILTLEFVENPVRIQPGRIAARFPVQLEPLESEGLNGALKEVSRTSNPGGNVYRGVGRGVLGNFRLSNEIRKIKYW